ncbi:MAG: hypothetical protein VBE63_08360 [Lamprobacter sp.]|uniref:hypothetical protein n=1 Tax=Lamprobacter sp. TaxID=3100796 RepID=UPI002B25DDC7|nr:hypothetical protein [Lamprobacter sp.]MEA3639942.1 hypothetical protein [Lamprobacter sp.]
MNLEHPFDSIRRHTGKTALSHLPTSQLVYQAQCKISPSTNPFIVETVDRLEEAETHVDALYREMDEVEDKLNSLLPLVVEIPGYEDSPVCWEAEATDAGYSEPADKIDLLRRYLLALHAAISEKYGYDA